MLKETGNRNSLDGPEGKGYFRWEIDHVEKLETAVELFRAMGIPTEKIPKSDDGTQGIFIRPKDDSSPVILFQTDRISGLLKFSLTTPGIILTGHKSNGSEFYSPEMLGNVLKSIHTIQKGSKFTVYEN